MNHPYANIIAALFTGVNPETVEFHKSAAEVLQDYHEPNYGALQKVAATFARNAYASAGLDASYEFFLFDGLTKVSHWLPEYDHFTDPVFRLIANHWSDVVCEQAAQESQEKSAAVAGILSGLGSLVAKGGPAAVKTLLTLGAATGAGAGALYWGLNRHATEDEDNIEAMKERLHHYNQITRELTQDLQRNSVSTPQAAKKTVQDDSGTPYVTT